MKSERIKKLVNFKKKVERRIEDLESQIEEQRFILEVVNSVLVEKGFKRAEVTKQKSISEPVPSKEESAISSTPSEPEYQKTIPLNTRSGEPLADLHVNQNSMHIIPAEDKTFMVNTPPFKQFLVERVLKKMKEKDQNLMEKGNLTSDEALSYDIIQEGDEIRELIIKNFDDKRLKELKSSTRWTLEKMYEKT
ncbi:MAG: hypothetical protein ACOC6H_00590 [Thermoproteota archaeon]